MSFKQKIIAYWQLMRFDKPIGILLLLWPTLWGLWLAANGMPPLSILSIFIAGVVIMRPAGCVINDIADRKIDGHVSRTKLRPLATGAVTLREAIILFSLLCFCGLLLVLQLNLLTIVIAGIALLLSSIYPFTKRFIYFPQLILGLAWYLAIPMAFAAIQGKVPILGWILYITVVLWTIIFDTIYAIADREDDLHIQVKSLAIFLGSYERFAIAIMQIIFLLLLIYLGFLAQLNSWYFIACMVTLSLMIYQQYLIKNLKPENCIKTFKNNHWIGLIIFIGIFLGIN